MLTWTRRCVRKAYCLRTYCTPGCAELLGSACVQKHLRKLMDEYRDVTQQIQDGRAAECQRKTLNRRQMELMPLANAFHNAQRALQDLEELQTLIQNTTEDQRLLDLMKEEQGEILKRVETLKEDLLQTLIPADKHDANDVILEVVSGRTTGGDICQQFTKEVFEMYEGFAGYKNWEFEVFNYTLAEYGGLHHAAARISGEKVYRSLKHEGGTHRVQRIPHVGQSSRMQRIHTGTMTVIVLPQPNKVDLDIDPKEIRVDTFRSRGAGGQSVNTTDSAVRLVHIPTGLAVECQQSRSQLKNRDTAMRMLQAKMYQQILSRKNQEMDATRRHQVGTRAQSERIRTYNFTQDRVTDHRIGYVTRDIKEFLHGGELLEDLITQLVKETQREALLELVSKSPSQ